MTRMDTTWGGTVALILRDCDPEVRLEFMRVLGQWKRTSTDTIQRNSVVGEETFDEDRIAAEQRMVKLQALEEHVERTMESDARWRAMFNDMWRSAGF